MKKIKLINSLAAVASLTTVVPVVTLSSCSKDKSKLGNLMEEYTPTIGQRVRESFSSVDKVVDAYLSAVKTTPQIFVEDFRYTISRGLPEYISYVSKFCEVKEHNFNLEIDPETVEVNEENQTIQFDAKIDVIFDYTGTKPEEMKWYDMNNYRIDSSSSLRFVFDFNTAVFTQDTPYGARTQMTTIAGATQLGISEIGSTVQILNRKGYYVDLDGIQHNFDETEESPKYHFMMPSERWWSTEDYVRIYNEIANLWYSYPDIQAFILLFKYYMGTSIFDTSAYKIPTSFDFGSYYMANVTLDDPYSFGNVNDDTHTCTLYGFNMSLDSINHTANLDKCNFSNGILTLPVNEKEGGTYTVTSIQSNAFNGDLAKYTNIGLVDDIKGLVVPANYVNIGSNAVSGNKVLESLKFSHTGENVDLYPSFSESTFVGLTNVKLIDFSTWNANIDSLITKYTYQGKEAFAQIHKGVVEETYGEIKIPSGQDEKWTQLLSLCFGLKIKSADSDGWELIH